MLSSPLIFWYFCLVGHDLKSKYKFASLEGSHVENHWTLDDTWETYFNPLSHRSSLAAVNCHANLSLQISFEEVLEGVIVLVQPRLPDGNDEVEEGLESGPWTGWIFLDAEHMIALGTSAGYLGTLTSAHDQEWTALKSCFLRSAKSAKKSRYNKFYDHKSIFTNSAKNWQLVFFSR